MAVGLKDLSELHPVSGIRWGTASAGIKKPGKRDLVVMEMSAGSTCAAVFTRNAFCAAPVIVARQHLTEASPRLLVINTGNANAGTGELGMRDAQAISQHLARLYGCAANQVLPFSTGVIGEPLPVEKILAALPKACDGLDQAGWHDAAHGILTTDTVPKGFSKTIALRGHPVTITGIAKGSGMIRPNMATMLAFIATDAAVEQDLLQRCLRSAVDRSFNCITVDGDTSTNDACILVATGKIAAPLLKYDDAEYAEFSQAITDVCQWLAQAIIRDGEGATKLITIEVNGGATEHECKEAAFAIAHSPLVKTAFFASDPNWGRILAAIGRSGIADLNVNGVTIYLGNVCIVENGSRAQSYEESLGREVMARDEMTIRVDLGRGRAHARVWTCDFSYDYVRINAEYRT